MHHIFCWGCENKLKTNRGVHKRAAQQPKQPNMSIKTMFAVELTGLHFTQPWLHICILFRSGSSHLTLSNLFFLFIVWINEIQTEFQKSHIFIPCKHYSTCTVSGYVLKTASLWKGKAWHKWGRFGIYESINRTDIMWRTELLEYIVKIIQIIAVRYVGLLPSAWQHIMDRQPVFYVRCRCNWLPCHNFPRGHSLLN